MDAGSIDPVALAQGKIPVDRDARVDLPDVLPAITGPVELAAWLVRYAPQVVASFLLLVSWRPHGRVAATVVETSTNFRGYFELDELYPG